MNIGNKIFFQVLALATLISCTEIESNINIAEAEQLSLEAWVEDVNAELISAGATEKQVFSSFVDGMYSLEIQEGTGSNIEFGDWVWIDYQGVDLSGDVEGGKYVNADIYANNDKTIAETIINTNLYSIGRVFYGPKLVRVAEGDLNLTRGQFVTLKDMKIGEERQIIMPSNMAYMDYGSKFSGGYEGGVVIGPNKPAIMTMTTKWKTQDIETYESELVWKYAHGKLGKTNKIDTIARNLYASITYMTIEREKKNDFLFLKAEAKKDNVLLNSNSVKEYGFEYRATTDSEWIKCTTLTGNGAQFEVEMPLEMFVPKLGVTSKDYVFRSYVILNELNDGLRLTSIFEYNSTDDFDDPDPDADADADAEPEENINIVSSYNGFNFNFEGYFIDVDNGVYKEDQTNAFLFDTSNKELAMEKWGEVILGEPLAYSSELVDAFQLIVESEKLTYGSSFTMVFTSKYGYGSETKQGKYSESGVISTTIQPHTPLVFNVQILDKVIPVVEEEEEEE